jgi:hypothetical protein
MPWMHYYRTVDKTDQPVADHSVDQWMTSYDYLHNVLQHIAAADTVEKLEALLPWNVKKC